MFCPLTPLSETRGSCFLTRLYPVSPPRKKKKKDKDKAKLLEAMGTSKKNEEEKRRGLDKRTPAQAAFEKMQEKRVGRLRLSPQPAWAWASRSECLGRAGTLGGRRAVREDLSTERRWL